MRNPTPARRASMQKWRNTNCEKVREYKLRFDLKKYRLTLDEYNNLLEKQNGVCAICKKPDNSGHRLSIDHDHKTNQIRGLLCHKCNRGLGCFGDDVVLMEIALNYIRVKS